jgi:hypothetical protein
MTSQEVKEALLLFRPELDDEADPDFAPALAQMRNDPELKKWFDQHCGMQKAVFAGFERLSVPEGLKEQILSERPKQILPTRRPKTRALVLAAIPLLLLVAFGVVYLRSPAAPEFAAYREAMVAKTSLERYPQMNLYSSDLGQIRQYLAEHGGQKDYVLPASLEKLQGTGCKILDWRGKRISMVCLNSGKNGAPKTPDLFLFIVDRAGVQQPSGHCGAPGPDIVDVRSKATASWTNGQKTYLLAGAGNADFLKQYY